jgi:hypothetical protein
MIRNKIEDYGKLVKNQAEKIEQTQINGGNRTVTKK